MQGGELIREARKRAGLTQRELAERLGTTQPVVARWESLRRSPDFATVVKAIRACGLDLAVSLATVDAQDDALLALALRKTPEQRLKANAEMLEFERRYRPKI